MKQQKEFSGLARFHRVDSVLWHAVDTLLWSFVRSRIESTSNVLVLRFTLDDAQLLTDFAAQMALSYVHPRRDALSLLYPSSNPFVTSLPTYE